MMRCPITHLYNQKFFNELLKKDLAKTQLKEKNSGFLVIQLDQLYQINKRFGNETGDEALRNMAYQLQQIKKPNTLLFKQNGPGIIIYYDNATTKEIQELAVEARNLINESNLFIEKVTASVSIASLDEIDRNQKIEKQIYSILTLLERRSFVARNKATSLIIDQNFEIPLATDGSILLVDEDEVSLNMLNRIFKRLHFDVKIARSAEEAMKIVESIPIDIIISEINLSKIDGFSLKKMLNESKDYQNIPFIMVSHNKTLENIKRCNLLNVNLILEKPIEPEELIGHVQRTQEWKRSI